MKVLVVEDETLIVMALEPVLMRAGYSIVGPYFALSDALCAAINEPDLDVALLDVNLRGERVDAVADTLDKRGIPFLFLTGYGREGVAERHRFRPCLIKPYFDGTLLQTLNDAVAKRRREAPC